MSVAKTDQTCRVLVCMDGQLLRHVLVAAMQNLGLDATDGEGIDLSTLGDRFDVLFIDVQSAVRRDSKLNSCPVVLLVDENNQKSHRVAQRMKVAACVSHYSDVRQLVSLVSGVARGNRAPTAEKRSFGPVSPSLTRREADVLQLIARGKDNAQVADTLGISPHTVRTHVEHILTKLEVRNRFSAVAAARRTGMLPATR